MPPGAKYYKHVTPPGSGYYDLTLEGSHVYSQIYSARDQKDK